MNEIIKTWERFWAKVNMAENGCWNWLASCFPNGYGAFWNGYKIVGAHRFAYELLMGAIPNGLEPDHLCRNRKCVNPEHMELVTRSENVKRGLSPEIKRQYQQAKTHCPQGHPYDSENTYIDSRGRRSCKICRREALRQWRFKKRH